MKKGLYILFASAMITSFVACGQSEEERKADSALKDTVAAETMNTTDSLIAMMERENAMADSTAKADSAAKADSGKAGK
jgi:uncharacterized lipoprotein YehR (DUF1307 family)